MFLSVWRTGIPGTGLSCPQQQPTPCATHTPLSRCAPLLPGVCPPTRASLPSQPCRAAGHTGAGTLEERALLRMFPPPAPSPSLVSLLSFLACL